MINSVAFFDLAHNGVMNWALAIGFELGAAASLAAIIILDKTSKSMVWTLFLLLTGFQMMANSYHAFVNLENYMPWIELFGLEEEEPIFQKRVLSIVSGAVLPIVALGFIKSLVDYIRPEKTEAALPTSNDIQLPIIEDPKETEPIKTTVEKKTDDISLKAEELIINKPEEAVINEEPKKELPKEGHVTIMPNITEDPKRRTPRTNTYSKNYYRGNPKP